MKNAIPEDAVDVMFYLDIVDWNEITLFTTISWFVILRSLSTSNMVTEMERDRLYYSLRYLRKD